ncbi:MAG: hypothetical protein D6812_05015 [Deltaproteobacteria bacterium]|nr:MAG: hypothetical protein D6812_05015 [Deltaproteobacteria bacterium]
MHTGRWKTTVHVAILVAGVVAGAFFAMPLIGISSSEGGEERYALADARILRIVISHIDAHYVDPDRIDPVEMLKGGLTALEKYVPEIQTEIDEEEPILVLRVAEAAQVLSFGKVTDLYTLLEFFREVFRFIEDHFSGTTPLQEIEYAAINGILNALDPHSRLLPPEVFQEFEVTTRGKFGGLGIVIGIRDGELTVIAPIEDTPAYYAGIKAKDKIVKIEDESTVNMSLTEAVGKLRGPEGTQVTIYIMREGFDEPRKFTITRAEIEIKSVTSQLLAGGIGFLKIKNFQENTFSDLKDHLDRLKCLNAGHTEEMCKPGQVSGRQTKGGELHGLILDFRNNPGGLLDQAIRIADKFLKSGIIVTTVDMTRRSRKEEWARRRNTEPPYPMAILVNGGSASASEIVSGALKVHDRAIVVGDNTFGKGSVQTLYNLPDNAALKLTVAKYLLPGDVSIQSVGIVPDYRLVPVIIDEALIDFRLGEEMPKEKDLEKHFEKSGNVVEKPTYTIKYLDEEYRRHASASGESAEGEEAADEAFEEEYGKKDYSTDSYVELARRLLLGASMGEMRPKILEQSAHLVEKIRKEEEAKIEKELAKLGIDWSMGPAGPERKATVAVEFLQDPPKARAGEEAHFILSVENRSTTTTLHRLIGVIDSENFLFNGREFPIGKLPPGATKRYELTVKIPKDTLTRVEEFEISFQEANGILPDPVTASIQIEGLPRPEFAYSYQVVDDGHCNSRGNGDGLIQKGEEICLLFFVKNVGKGTAEETQAYLKNVQGKEIFMKEGRVELGALPPGAIKEASFLFQVRNRVQGEMGEEIPVTLDTFDLEVTILDAEFREYLVNKLHFPIDSNRVTVMPQHQWVETTTTPLPIYGGASTRAPIVARVTTPSVFLADGKLPGWYRIRIDEERHGWITADRVAITNQPPAASKGVELFIQNVPPEIELVGTTFLTPAHDRIQLRGIVKAPENFTHRVKDTYIFANEDKVFFKSFNTGKEAQRLAHEFVAEFPLEAGNNLITIIARDENDLIARKSFFIRPEGSGKETAKANVETF